MSTSVPLGPMCSWSHLPTPTDKRADWLGTRSPSPCGWGTGHKLNSYSSCQLFSNAGKAQANEKQLVNVSHHPVLGKNR